MFIVMLAAAARAGAPSVDCQRPWVFGNAAVNLVVLPYEYHSVTGDTRASEAARQIPLLIQANGLLHMLHYRSVGSLNFVNFSGDPACNTDEVLHRIEMDGPSSHQLRSGAGLIMVWGTLYQEGDQFQLQTFMRILRRDRDEHFDVTLPDNNAVRVRPSGMTLAFPPQSLTRSDLDQIRIAFRKAVEVHTDTSFTSHIASFSFYEPSAPGAAYSVQKAVRGWLQVTNQMQEQGWIRADFGWDGSKLSARLPEVEFIDLATGYLSVRVASENGGSVPANTLDAMRASLARYLVAASEEEDDAVPAAVGRQLVAITACEQVNGIMHDWMLADTLATRAAELLPNDAEAQRMAGAMTLMADAGRGQPASRSVLVERRFARAAVLSSEGEPNGLNDLAILYSLASAPTPADPLASAGSRLTPQIASARLALLRSGAFHSPQSPSPQSPAPGPSPAPIQGPAPIDPELEQLAAQMNMMGTRMPDQGPGRMWIGANAPGFNDEFQHVMNRFAAALGRAKGIRVEVSLRGPTEEWEQRTGAWMTQNILSVSGMPADHFRIERGSRPGISVNVWRGSDSPDDHSNPNSVGH